MHVFQWHCIGTGANILASHPVYCTCIATIAYALRLELHSHASFHVHPYHQSKQAFAVLTVLYQLYHYTCSPHLKRQAWAIIPRIWKLCLQLLQHHPSWCKIPCSTWDHASISMQTRAPCTPNCHIACKVGAVSMSCLLTSIVLPALSLCTIQTYIRLSTHNLHALSRLLARKQ